MKTLHMIGNAHLDPVWLWRKCDGVDSALATARSACDRLDEYGEFVFTCSGSWFHETVQELDAELFGRIRRFVEAGRWRLVGGMVIQPDCNLPSEESFARQLQVGQDYFRRTFGRATTVGYNVDSFGHTAYLPRFFRQAGIDSYVFMRPGPHEKTLPSVLFRWRSPDGHEVTAFRISGAYCTWEDDLATHIKNSLATWPEGSDHMMCYYGVGDHGGGPTKAQIEWILKHAEDYDGVRLVLSHPQAFFDAVASMKDRLPVLEDELQHHAIGCYSVERRIKLAMRDAENRLLQAERTIAALSQAVNEADRLAVREGWKTLLFNQFHDVLGGTSLLDASADAVGEMCAAKCAADKAVTAVTRRAFRRQARPGTQKIVVFNPGAENFAGLTTHNPWVGWGDRKNLVLRDESGRVVTSQWSEHSFLTGLGSLLWNCDIPAGGTRFFTLAEGSVAAAATTPHALWEKSTIADGDLRVGDVATVLEVCDDPTDTWSHSAVNRFGREVVGRFAFSAPEKIEEGPIFRVSRAGAEFDRSRAWVYWMGVAGESLLRLRVSVHWTQTRQRLQLRLELSEEITERVDLVSGGPLARRPDGLEYPLSGATLVSGGRRRLAVLAPDVFSLSVEGRAVRLTLLRSPFVAHHDPDNRLIPGRPATDHGDHTFDIFLWPGCDANPKDLAQMAGRLSRPPIVWDLTG